MCIAESVTWTGAGSKGGEARPGQQSVRGVAPHGAGPRLGICRGAQSSGSGHAGVIRSAEQRELPPGGSALVALRPESGPGKRARQDTESQRAQGGSGNGVGAQAGRMLKRRRPAQRLYSMETLVSPWEAAEAAAEVPEKLFTDQDDADLHENFGGP